jgi:hypothetical protein
MPDPVSKRLASLPDLSKTELRDLWKQVFTTTAPHQLRRDFMIPILAYRIQEQAYGSISTGSRNRLRRLVRAFEINPDSAIPSTRGLKPGTRLVRQWQDQVHLVNVEEKGFEYNGIRYQSLSEIARSITGTRWSGPLFFGIKGKRGNKELKEAR